MQLAFPFIDSIAAGLLQRKCLRLRCKRAAVMSARYEMEQRQLQLRLAELAKAAEAGIC